MQRTSATVVSAVWFVLAPGIVGGLVPWLITGWHGRDLGPWWLPLRLTGMALIIAGVLVLLRAFAQFVRDGRGSPAPVAAPQRLVANGLYRYVRNPMYMAVIAVLIGQVLVIARYELVWYTGAVMALCMAFVYLHEEPNLRRRFGARYVEYRRRVPAWIPRLRSRQPPHR